MKKGSLTPHFQLSEFACHDGTPAPQDCVDQMQLLAVRFLEPLRRVYGPVTITSGYRHESYNRRIGGARDSFHIYRADRRGIAVDLRAARGRPKDWAAVLQTCGPCGLSVYSGHVHVDSRGANARW